MWLLFSSHKDNYLFLLSVKRWYPKCLPGLKNNLINISDFSDSCAQVSQQFKDEDYALFGHTYLLLHQVDRRLGQVWHFELWYAMRFIGTCVYSLLIFRLQDFKLGTTDLQKEMLSHHSGKFLVFWYRWMHCHVNWLLYQRFWATHCLHLQYVLWNVAYRLPVGTASHLSMPLSSVCRILLKYVYDASHFHHSWLFCSVSMREKKVGTLQDAGDSPNACASFFRLVKTVTIISYKRIGL